jgi:diguanylate cyclase (GGDEF)-like protein
VELQQKLVSANSVLHNSASHDFLTNAWNRGSIVACLQREVARSLREAAALGVILVDVDHCKKVNDELGHESGDCVLQEIREAVLRQSARLRWSPPLWRGRVLVGYARLRPDNDCTASQCNQRIDSRANRFRLLGVTTVTVSMGVAVAVASTKFRVPFASRG